MIPNIKIYKNFMFTAGFKNQYFQEHPGEQYLFFGFQIYMPSIYTRSKYGSMKENWTITDKSKQ